MTPARTVTVTYCGDDPCGFRFDDKPGGKTGRHYTCEPSHVEVVYVPAVDALTAAGEVETAAALVVDLRALVARCLPLATYALMVGADRSQRLYALIAEARRLGVKVDE